jgi:hypothetical protein
LIQLNDLLIGALGFRKNGRHHLPGSAAHKTDLAQHIASKVASIQKVHPSKSTATRFTIWEFKYRN